MFDSMVVESFRYGSKEFILETGKLARQATGAVKVTVGDTVVLVTAVAATSKNPDADFLQLSVHYQERSYAAGMITGGHFKREGRPSVKETLISRLIDRPLRPVFPDGFNQEVQIIATVLSVDAETDADIAAILGASAALAVSGIPFLEPIGAARVGYENGHYVLNPATESAEKAALELVVAGTKEAILMVESGAKGLSEEVMLGAVLYGHEQMQVAIEAIERLAKKGGKPRTEWSPVVIPATVSNRLSTLARVRLEEAYRIREKQARRAAIDEIRLNVLNDFNNEPVEGVTAPIIQSLFSTLEKDIVQTAILNGHTRIDGRDVKTVRPIEVEVDLLPRAHGSALFTRGETQALVVATLAGEKGAQWIEDIVRGDYQERFLFHYNFPHYAVGEVGMVSSPKRREIGHGALARRAMLAVLPEQTEFPYVIRVVSEITESNGSSSMASVCGASLSLMAAGVPIQAPVAGVAMGLIKEGNQYVVLTDISGDEDHLGHMDFKVAGTKEGVTALQMDIKVAGITREIMAQALEQAKEARLHILNEMNSALGMPRTELSARAPRIVTFKVHPDKIRTIIGKGGVTIRALSEETGASIDITDEGIVTVAAKDQESGEEVQRKIERLIADAEVGQTYEGTVVKIVDFGAFVNILPGKDGLVHISEISQERIENVADHLTEGQVVSVKLLEIDRQGRIRLSMKAAKEEAQ